MFHVRCLGQERGLPGCPWPGGSLLPPGGPARGCPPAPAPHARPRPRRFLRGRRPGSSPRVSQGAVIHRRVPEPGPGEPQGAGPAVCRHRQPARRLRHIFGPFVIERDECEASAPELTVHLQPRDMSCYNQCLPCQPCGPTPLANSCNEPCVRQCQSSTVAIEPPAVVVTLPGPILSSFPQNTVVGSSTSAAVGSILSCDGVPINSGCCDLSGISSRYYGRRFLR